MSLKLEDAQIICIQIQTKVLNPHMPFKFTNALTSFYGFMQLMEAFWGDTKELIIFTSAMFRFSKKLKAVKTELRRLSKEKLGDLFKQTKEAYEELYES